MSTRPHPVPIWFGTERAELFGQLHLPATAGGPVPHGSRGVVVLPPFGIEGNSAHRPLRHLAEHLADAGHPVLRYDHRATGDSAGWDTDYNLVRSWLDDVGTAIDTIRQEAGVETVTLVGMRLGATLAALHASARRDDVVDRVVLWAPVAAGKTYARELKTLARMQRSTAQEAAPANDASSASSASPWAAAALETAGFAVSPATLADLTALDLLQPEQPPARDVLIIGRDDLQRDEPLALRYRELGADVRLDIVPGYTDLRLDDPEKGQLPTEAIAAIVTWISTGRVDRVSEIPALARPIEVSVHLASTDAPHRWNPDGAPAVSERSLRLGADGRIFGIDTQRVTGPSQQAAPEVMAAPLLVLLNTGSNPRTGPGRLHVALARQLASAGVRVLRIDLSGVGDTAARPGAPEVRPYEEATVHDVTLATGAVRDLMRASGMTGQLVLAGICSGAWAAYHAALADAPVPDRLVLINQIIHDDASWAGEGETPAMAFKARHELGQAFRGLDKWKRLVRGDLKVMPVLRRLGMWARLRVGKILQSHAQPAVARQLQRIAERGVGQLHVFDEPESGLAYLRLHAPRLLEGPQRPPGLHLITLSGTGHTFGALAAQETLARLLAEQLLVRGGQNITQRGHEPQAEAPSGR